MITEKTVLTRLAELSQQDFLRQAQEDLNMTRDALCERFDLRRRTLDKWFLPDTSNDFRHMPASTRKYIAETVAHTVGTPPKATKKK